MPYFPEELSTMRRTRHDDSACEAMRLATRAPQVETDELERTRRIRIKNRRRRYLELHPEYFIAPRLELADPLLYDRSIRRFQTAAERERAGRDRGYAERLEAHLVRSEAKLEALQHPDPNAPITYERDSEGAIVGVERSEGERAATRDEGWERWRDAMGDRFVRGADDEFEYEAVDGSEDFDDRAEEDRLGLEAYLDGEEEVFLGSGEPVGQTGVQDF